MKIEIPHSTYLWQAKHALMYGGLNVLEVQMGVAVQRKLPAQHLKPPKAG